MYLYLSLYMHSKKSKHTSLNKVTIAERLPDAEIPAVAANHKDWANQFEGTDARLSAFFTALHVYSVKYADSPPEIRTFMARAAYACVLTGITSFSDGDCYRAPAALPVGDAPGDALAVAALLQAEGVNTALSCQIATKVGWWTMNQHTGREY